MGICNNIPMVNKQTGFNTMNMQVFAEKFETFFQGCKQINEKHMAEQFASNQRDTFTYTTGSRYWKVVRGSSVHCFVDATNGDVLKAASWKAPAKGARGNIFDEHNGLARMSVYGTQYNK